MYTWSPWTDSCLPLIPPSKPMFASCEVHCPSLPFLLKGCSPPFWNLLPSLHVHSPIPTQGGLAHLCSVIAPWRTRVLPWATHSCLAHFHPEDPLSSTGLHTHGLHLCPLGTPCPHLDYTPLTLCTLRTCCLPFSTSIHFVLLPPLRDIFLPLCTSAFPWRACCSPLGAAPQTSPLPTQLEDPTYLQPFQLRDWRGTLSIPKAITSSYSRLACCVHVYSTILALKVPGYSDRTPAHLVSHPLWTSCPLYCPLLTLRVSLFAMQGRSHLVRGGVAERCHR